MKAIYKIDGERYGRVHELHRIDGNEYCLETDMHLPFSVHGENDNIRAVDPEGGPMMSPGWHNDEITIKEIYFKGKKLIFNIEEINGEQ